MSRLSVVGISCLLAGLVSGSPLPEPQAAAPDSDEIRIGGEFTLDIIDRIVTTTVTIYGPSLVASTSSDFNADGPSLSYSPGGPMSPAYPFPNTTSSGAVGTGTAAASDTIGSLTWLSTGTAPVLSSMRANSTVTAPRGTGTVGSAPIRTAPIGTGTGTGTVGTGASTGVIPSPSGGVLPPYRNSTVSSFTPSPAPSGYPVPVGTAPLNSTTTVFVTAPTPQSSLPTQVTSLPAVLPAVTPPISSPTTSSSSTLVPTPVITPTPAPTSSISPEAAISLAYVQIERIIASVVEEFFPFVTGLPGWPF